MASKRPNVGQLNTYVPSVLKVGDRWYAGKRRKEVDEETAKLLKQAAWKIPSALHRFAAHLDGSNWVYPMAFDDRAKILKDEFDGKAGINIYVSEKVTWENEAELWRAITNAVAETVDDIKESLKGSLKDLESRFDELDMTDADGLIVDKVRVAKASLKDISFVIASLALSDDFREGEKGVEMAIEAGLVAARTTLGRRHLAEMRK
jgi:hypothetical protein